VEWVRFGPLSDEFAVRRPSFDVTERDPALDGFDALIGAWATEATHPKGASAGLDFGWDRRER
jgi:hypothetical protein